MFSWQVSLTWWLMDVITYTCHIKRMMWAADLSDQLSVRQVKALAPGKCRCNPIFRLITRIDIFSIYCEIAFMWMSYWFRWWRGVVRQQAIAQANLDLNLCHHMASQGYNELSLTASQCITMSWYLILSSLGAILVSVYIADALAPGCCQAMRYIEAWYQHLPTSIN